MPRYAFLGPEGTYSEVALLSLNIPDVQAVAYPTIPEVFLAVESGKADAGVVPIENSVEGSVNATLDALAFDHDLVISREIVLDIHHSLIAAPGTTLAGLAQVFAHPQAAAQCRKWLGRTLPDTPVVAANSNAEAVQMAVAEPGAAALGPALAAELYGGEILVEDVEDFAGNQTRFVLVGREAVARTGSDKTSLALFLRADKPGALLMILSEFAYGGINLTKLQSRPTKRALGDYMFFIDLEGHADDENVQLALSCLRLKLRTVKVLGSYPKAK
jgi:prephenate dehydratase